MKNIGYILKSARENSNYTQKQVMALTGINSKSLSGYENNVAEPDLYTFAKLAKLYGLSADEVLEINNTGVTTASMVQELRLLSLFRTLDSAHKDELLIALNAIVKNLSGNA